MSDEETITSVQWTISEIILYAVSPRVRRASVGRRDFKSSDDIVIVSVQWAMPDVTLYAVIRGLQKVRETSTGRRAFHDVRRYTILPR